MNNLKVGCFVLGMVQTNCYFIYAEDNRKHEQNSFPPDTKEEELTPVIFIDPSYDGKLIYDELKGRGFKVELILLTHAHFDHIGGLPELKELSHAPVYAYEKEEALCEHAENNMTAEFYGRSITFVPDRYLKDDEIVEAAGMKFRVIATPGHTAGSCCYYFEDERILFSGDTVFEGSVGRTDYPTGSGSVLQKSIKEKILPLPDETVIFPGHGGETSLGNERQYNPFFY